MPLPLLNPDNRLLGGSIADMSLYGAAVPGGEIVRTGNAADEPEQSETAPDGGGGGGPPAEVPFGPTLTDFSLTPVDPSAGLGVFSVGPVSPLSTGPDAPASTGSGDALAGASPETGSGSVAGGAVPPPTLDSAASPGGEQPAGSNAIASVGDPAALTLPASPVTALIAPVVATIADGLLSDPAIVATVAGIAPAIAEIAATAAGDAATLLADAGETAAAAISAPETLSTALSDSASVAAVTAAPVVDALAGVGDPVDGNNLLTGVGGGDPAGGVATLVQMIASADHFDLSQAGDDLAPDTTSMVDLLAIDAVVPPPADDHHDLTHALDDGGHGLLGL